MATVRQSNFSGGELAPSAWGRTDLEIYHAGLRRCRNFFIDRRGAAVTRPGMKFVDFMPAGPVRLVPFVYSDTESYVLSFTNRALDVYRTSTNERVAVLVSPYLGAVLPRLQWIQSGNVLFLTTGLNAPHELIRIDESTWEFREISFDVPAYSGEIPLVVTLPAADELHPAKRWRYMVTRVLERDDGLIMESAPVEVKNLLAFTTGPDGTVTNRRVPGDPLPEELVVYPDRPIEIDFHNYQALTLSRVASTRIYRGRDGVMGFVGEVPGDAARQSFKDYGQEPDYYRPPPRGDNPFKVLNEDGSLKRIEFPAAVGMFEQRLIFGGTPYRPGRLWCSATDDYFNFDEKFPSVASDSLSIELASSRREEIRFLLGMEKMLVFTNSSVWAVGGEGTAIGGASRITARMNIDVGVDRVRPLVVGDTVLFVRNKGCGVRDLFYDDWRRSFTGGNLTDLAHHFFDGHRIVDWCYAEDPWGLVWAVRDDGKLLSFTYNRDPAVRAWAMHETEGTVRAVCSVPDGTHDAVFLAVLRRGQYTLERMGTGMYDKASDARQMDSYVEFTVNGIGAPDTEITIPMFHLYNGTPVVVYMDGNVYGPFPITGGAVLTGIKTGNRIVTGAAGIPYTATLELLDVPEARTKNKIVKRVTWEALTSRGIWAGTEDNLAFYENKERTVEDQWAPMGMHTGEYSILVAGRWAKHGRAILEQRDPVPAIVYGVTREGDIGG